MAIGDLLGKGKDFLDKNKDTVDGALRSQQAEDISDKVLDAGAAAAKKVAPTHGDAIDGVRDNLDKQIGTE